MNIHLSHNPWTQKYLLALCSTAILLVIITLTTHYNIELQKREAERQAEYAGKDAIAFGSQIRTYTLQPYRLVKDHRTSSEAGDVEAVLNGQIDQFQHDYLLHRHEQQR